MWQSPDESLPLRQLVVLCSGAPVPANFYRLKYSKHTYGDATWFIPDYYIGNAQRLAEVHRTAGDCRGRIGNVGTVVVDCAHS